MHDWIAPVLGFLFLVLMIPLFFCILMVGGGRRSERFIRRSRPGFTGNLASVEVKQTGRDGSDESRADERCAETTFDVASGLPFAAVILLALLAVGIRAWPLD